MRLNKCVCNFGPRHPFIGHNNNNTTKVDGLRNRERSADLSELQTMPY